MNTTRRSLVLLATAALGVVAVVACAPPSRGAGPAPASTTARDTALDQGMRTIVRLASERVKTADVVAAAKWGTRQPIDDPDREQAVLDGVTAQAAKRGVDEAAVRRIFEDQIAANKAVQVALHAQWQARPAERPTHRLDLATQVRPVLDRVDGQLLTAIQQVQHLLSAPGCEVALSREIAAAARAQGLDALHRSGLDQALAHTCAPR
ncbi:chorismate mutase [Streptomyces sp. NPDC098789]|uniref:chorismate mutase n=1 Tax=Streptomyces sp. NPDC098789 TaxID=3366098 RepID=UPI0037F92AE1